jgi:hypothetical protein
MSNPDRLSLSVTHADGTVTRWAPDEPDAANVLDDLEFSTATPGGYRTLSCSLLRDLRRARPDQALFDQIRAYGPGGRTAWEGRMTQFPYADGTISPGGVGWAAHLKDDYVVEIYVDRDPATSPTSRSTARARSATLGISSGDFSWSQDTGGLSAALPVRALRDADRRRDVADRAGRREGQQDHVPRGVHEPARRMWITAARAGHARRRRRVHAHVRRHAAHAGAHDRRGGTSA